MAIKFIQTKCHKTKAPANMAGAFSFEINNLLKDFPSL